MGKKQTTLVRREPLRPAIKNLHQLFVYGIFLDFNNRLEYEMQSPSYAVVPDYTTRRIGGSIVEAVYVANCGLGLTGLLVTLPVGYDWTRLDSLEWGYDRTIVHTESGERAWMYVSRDEQ